METKSVHDYSKAISQNANGLMRIVLSDGLPRFDVQYIRLDHIDMDSTAHNSFVIHLSVKKLLNFRLWRTTAMMVEEELSRFGLVEVIESTCESASADKNIIVKMKLRLSPLDRALLEKD